ncbi:hypothetical protein PInf_015233 [Phytophthora infestans]|nr:hypothetical protein PInf_015233 [Phytophthora infestans]
MKAMYMNSFVRLPGVREALSVRRNAVLRHEAAPRKPEVIGIDDDGDDLWPMGVDKMKNRPATTRWSFSSRALEARKSTLMRVITRMLNHSCDAPCHFVELRNRENVAVVVVAKRTIEVGEETVDYVDPWFDCVCAAYCRG